MMHLSVRRAMAAVVSLLSVVVLAPVAAGRADASIQYTDVSTSRHEAMISIATDAGLVHGCAPQRYCPLEAVTRGQMATMLARALDLPPVSRDYFPDDQGSPHEDGINRVTEAGVASGYPDGTFGPNEQLSRGQVAAVLHRALGLPVPPGDTFIDDDKWVFEADIEALVAAGITHGCAPRRFCPGDKVQRGQMAAFLVLGFGLGAGDAPPPSGPGIAGTLRDLRGETLQGEPIYCVVAKRPGSDVNDDAGTTSVDESGNWWLALPPGEYELRSWPCIHLDDGLTPRYLPVWYDGGGGADGRDGAIPVEVQPGPAVTKVDFRIPGGTLIYGTVLDSNGDPVDNAIVSAWDVSNDRWEGFGSTNANGSFRVPLGHGGTYKMSMHQGFRPVWYPAGGWRQDAEIIHVDDYGTITLPPVTTAPEGDADGDGLSDFFEFTGPASRPDGSRVYTNILDPDSDGDGIDDATEIAQHTDPTKA